MTRKHKSVTGTCLTSDTSHAARSNISGSPAISNHAMSKSASNESGRYANHRRRLSADHHATTHACCSEQPCHKGMDAATGRSRRSPWSGPNEHHDVIYPPPSRAAWCTQPQRPCSVRPVPVIGARPYYPSAAPIEMQPVHAIPVQRHLPGLRPHSHSPAAPLHDIGFGPTPLFGWDSVQSLPHSYGLPQYPKYVKPDYRRFCYSVGKADVPYAALPGGPLYGYPTTLSPQLLGRW